MQEHIGHLVRHWRTQRRMSQLQLAEEAEVSTRHLSYLENGRARPSREMVLVLASAMEVPLRERNTLLRAAGFAPVYRETDLDAPQMAQVRRALDFLLRQSEPYGAVVVDRLWNILLLNRPMRRMLGWLTGSEALPDGANLLRIMFDPEGFKPFLANWDEVARATLDRVHREAVAEGDAELAALHEELLAVPGVPAHWRQLDWERPPALVVPVVLEKAGVRLSLFTTLTTLGTPTDITLSELRIESYFPADEATEAFARALAASRPPQTSTA